MERDEHASIERMSEDECWRLLADAPVGRVGVIVEDAPEIYPVNHLVDDRTIVFRTDPGTKLAGLAQHPVVCFQADGFDPRQRIGWSVLVKGHAQLARRMPDAAERGRVEGLPVDYWAPGPKWHRVRIVPADVTGRRILHVTAGEDEGSAPG